MRETLHAAAAIRSKPGIVSIRLGGKILSGEWGDRRGDVFAKVAIAALKHGQTELVEQSLDQVQYPLTRGLLLCDLADAEREGGNLGAGRRWMDEARRLVASATWKASRTQLQSRIVESLVGMGRLEEAADIDRAAGDENVKRVHAVALAKAGRYEAALKLVEGIKSPDVRAMGITQMATKMLGAQQK